MPLSITKDQFDAIRQADRLLHRALDEEQHVPSLAALEQLGGSEFDFAVELPRREAWQEQVTLEEW